MNKPAGCDLPRLFLTAAAIGLLAAAGFAFVEIDTDVTRYLPGDDPVIADAGYIFRNHPVQDRMVIDIGLSRPDPDLLAAYGERVEGRLRDSGLFTEVGMGSLRRGFPDLMAHVADHLPVLFTDRQLREKVAPRLAPGRIRERLAALRADLFELAAIGRTPFIGKDPLGLSDLVLARLYQLAPAADVRFHKGKLLSTDGRHLLITGTPSVSGTDTAFAARLADALAVIAEDLETLSSVEGNPATLTPVGAYRAALDNERIAKRDVKRAILLAALGIAVLLLFAFPRPWIGLLAFLPALAGTAAAFFVCALVHERLSIMALGFGGALISITVDHGIAYLLFLDRPHASRGEAASREIRAVGLLAALTTMGAFGSLYFSDFPIFRQLGLFTALGIGFSFLFVHLGFPGIFPELPPGPDRPLPLRRVVVRLFSFGGKGAAAALVFGLAMIPLARPHFRVDLTAMNTVSRETAAAEDLLGRVWGTEIFTKIHVMTEADSLPGLRTRWDRLLDLAESDLAKERLAGGFVPAMIFPGPERRQSNHSDWRAFWTPGRTAAVADRLTSAGLDLGFTADAFAPFLACLHPDYRAPDPGPVPETLFPLLAIRPDPGSGRWSQFSTLTPGPDHDPAAFHRRYGDVGRVFDPAHFSRRLGDLLFSTFARMVLLVGLAVVGLLFLFFFDWRLAGLSLLPVVFALAATLGTLRLMGRPMDIPGLMLAIVVFGMGIDYAIYLVRAHQRYADGTDPAVILIHVAVTMAAASTLIGFGVLYFSEHTLLRSAGITSFLGIGYALAGAILILPPILSRLFRKAPEPVDRSRPLPERVRRRYRHREGYPRLFVRFKLRLDPLFGELDRFLEGGTPVKTAVDIGCGYGVPGCWLLERFPGATVRGIDPDPERVRIAAFAWGGRGEARIGRAPEIPEVPEPVDLALVLDMIHFLDDTALGASLSALRDALTPGGRLLLRAVVAPPRGRPSWTWRLQVLGLKLSGKRTHPRSAGGVAGALARFGFEVLETLPSGGNEELIWFHARKT